MIRHESLRFPICLFRNGTDSFTALWMQCSHQGAELQVAGNQLTCPAHGSAFDHLGNVVDGPAARALRTFPVSLRDSELFIDLRKPNT
ncbi:Rieske (2Fe-2S) protein [Mucilaginibacter defluvii]|uniref:Rieske (2Fe-2S) protein n=1 Tax=Mucilaginibacter defluvii TaxID=1196019 RepID=UPI0031EF36CB